MRTSILFTVIISNEEYAKTVSHRDEFAARFADGWFVERSFGKPLGNYRIFFVVEIYENFISKNKKMII